MPTPRQDRLKEELTVLVVETSPALRHQLAELLHGEGFVVNEARNADEAVHRAQMKRPDLIVLHLVPRTFGMYMLEALQRHPDTRGVPIIGVGGSRASAAPISESAVTALLPHAIDADILLENVWQVVNLCVLGGRGP